MTARAVSALLVAGSSAALAISASAACAQTALRDPRVALKVGAIGAVSDAGIWRPIRTGISSSACSRDVPTSARSSTINTSIMQSRGWASAEPQRDEPAAWSLRRLPDRAFRPLTQMVRRDGEKAREQAQ